MKYLISLVTSIKPVLNNAFSAVITEARERGQKWQHLKSPEHFKCGKLLKIDNDSIHREMDNWPTCIMVGGCSKKLSAGNKLTTLL